MFIPETVKKAVDTYMSLSHKLLPDYQLELFIHGSIGLNTYESNKSDIDCIIVTNPELTLDQKEILNQLHLQFEQQENIPMDCVYIAKADLSSQSPFLNTYFYYNEGTLSYGDYFNFNSVTWWTLHQNYQDPPFPTTYRFSTSRLCISEYATVLETLYREVEARSSIRFIYF
ncbi:nucleotidyltransferase domain-containing protein [Kurthia gibsonii]|uniref:nucleotidyltransferase domain-containing protein n=1 Tax=Kurthia gibsonii TaxID=33946 RepID=UPI002DB8A705|nr:nucleotidyltransferase domain-containing protein [Kurthia gibsonii]MEB7772557.1 nucleotidyltransferase domain-containing protein [Kurthia gibsonii]